MVEAQENIDGGVMVKGGLREQSEVNEGGSGKLEEEETYVSTEGT